MIKLSKKKSGILASHVVISPYVPWYIRLLLIVIMILLLAALSWGMYNAGRASAKPDEKVVINTELYGSYDSGRCLQKGEKELCSQLAELLRQLQINSTLRKDLAKQVKSLGNENSRLKEELSFFQHLMSGNEKVGSGVSVHRFDLKQKKTPGKYKFTLLLAQGGQRPENFQGDLKFLVSLRQNDGKKVVPLISSDTSKLFPVNFKFYQRVNEIFQVPPNAVVESLQVQVFKKDSSKAQLTKTVKPSM